MALVGALSSLRASVLRHISVPAQSAAAQQSVGEACSLIFRRGFAEGTYLDKSQVTDRVLEVTKSFGSKVDASKVRIAAKRCSPMTMLHLQLRRDGSGVSRCCAVPQAIPPPPGIAWQLSPHAGFGSAVRNIVFARPLHACADASSATESERCTRFRSVVLTPDVAGVAECELQGAGFGFFGHRRGGDGV
jgi:hypothetical protein